MVFARNMDNVAPTKPASNTTEMDLDDEEDALMMLKSEFEAVGKDTEGASEKAVEDVDPDIDDLAMAIKSKKSKKKKSKKK